MATNLREDETPHLPPLYCVGIGGVGLSGLALLWRACGGEVWGSDCQESPRFDQLRDVGVQVWVGHDLIKIPSHAWVVISPAIADDHPIRDAIKEKSFQTVTRLACMMHLLGDRPIVAITGTHGKTTTTAWLVYACQQAGLYPGYFIGGDTAQLVSHASWGTSPWFILELDESDRSFVQTHAHTVLVTNLQHDHLKPGETLASLQNTMVSWLRDSQAKQIWLNQDDEGTKHCSTQLQENVHTYGYDQTADYTLEESKQGLAIHDQAGKTWQIVPSLPGRYNRSNASIVALLARELVRDEHSIASAIASFQGVKRRLDYLGVWQQSGHACHVYDDYAHHPEALASMVGALEERYPGAVIHVCFQPHRYTRTQQLFTDFVRVLSNLSKVHLWPHDTAYEKDIAGVNSESLSQACEGDVTFLPQAKDWEVACEHALSHGDVLVFAGAGWISTWARSWWQRKTMVC